MDVIKKLKILLANSGLSEEEVIFYINSLKKPESSIYEIAKKSKIQKDRAYKVYESLIEKELLENDETARNKRVIARGLQKFIENIKGEGRKLYKTADSLKSVNTFLPLLGMEDEKISIESYGADEIAERFVDMAYMDYETILAYGTFEDFIETLTITADRQFVSKRLKKGRKAFPILANPGPYTMEIAGNDLKENRRTRLINDEKLHNCFVTMLPESDRISFWHKDKVTGQISGALVQSRLLSQIHRNIYEHLEGEG